MLVLIFLISIVLLLDAAAALWGVDTTDRALGPEWELHRLSIGCDR